MTCPLRLPASRRGAASKSLPWAAHSAAHDLGETC